MACFSFYPGKNLGAYGEGGLVVTGNEEYARTIRMLRDWGQDRKYHHVLAGYNYRMEGMQGAILRVKLRHLEKWTEARRAHAARYRELLADTGLGLPAEAPGCRHVYHVYAVRTREREALMKPAQRAGHPDRDPLPGAGPPAAGVRRRRLDRTGPSRTARRRPTRSSPCRCTPR